MFIALSSLAKPLQEFTRVTWMNVGWRQVAGNAYAKLQTGSLMSLVDDQVKKMTFTMLKTVQNAAALRISYHTKLTKACVISSTVGGFRLRLAPDLLTWSSLLWHSVANSLSFVYSIRREHEQLWTQFTRHVNKTDWSTNNKTQNKLN